MKLLGNRFARAALLACASLTIFSATAAAYEQGFESLADSGWTTVNLSEAPSSKPWSQGEHYDDLDPVWSAHSGTPDSFVSGTLFAGSEFHKAQNDWLISPKFSTLSNGDEISFYMRARQVIHKLLYTNEDLEVRVSSNGGCSPGDSTTSVGDFATRLAHLDTATYDDSVVPGTPFNTHFSNPVWTEEGAVIGGLPAGEHTGCVAIRHSTPSSWGANPLVGIDDFRLEDRRPQRPTARMLAPLPPRAGVLKGVWFHAVAPPGSTVTLYRNGNCALPSYRVVNDEQLQWTGQGFPISPNSLNQFSARVVGSEGSSGKCQKLFQYLHGSVPPTSKDGISPPTVAAAGSTQPSVRPSKSSLRSRRGSARLRLICAGEGDAPRCTGEVSIFAEISRTLKLKLVTPVPARFSIAAGSTAEVAVPLSAAARRFLAHTHRETPWAQVRISSGDVSSPRQLSFWRKLKP